VNHAGADVMLYQDDTIRSMSVDGGGYPVHKPVTAGWSGYGDLQRTTEEAVRMNVRAVADHLTRLVDEADPAVVFVCGELRSRTDLVSALPERVAHRVSQLHAGARKSSLDEDEIREPSAAEFARRRCIEMSDIAERFPSRNRPRVGAGSRRVGPGMCGAA
jgi:Bacterial archaeo-eukaryotic release factor family 2